MSSVSALPDANVVVVDNASTDGSIDSIADLVVEMISLENNGGFAHGCNVGFRAGTAPYVLFLNPDATIDAASLEALVSRLDGDAQAGAAGPRLLHHDGSLEDSQRRFPRTSTIVAQALFLHRIFPQAAWADDAVHQQSSYVLAQNVDWLPAACLLVRRDVLERLGGLDEEFFHYCEDMDLCRRIHDLGYGICFEPAATAMHVGGQSAPRTALLARLTASKLRYASKHRTAAGRESERVALALFALTHAVVPGGGLDARRGYRQALAVAVRGRMPPTAGTIPT